MPEIILAEKWQEIPGWSGYEISTRGKIRSRWARRGCQGKRGSEVYLGDEYHDIKTKLAGGRLIVTLGGGKDGTQKTFGVAYLVLLTFVRPPEEGEVARHYLKPDPMNCRLGNLKWGSRFDNAQDIVRHEGKYHASKLTPEQVYEIIAILDSDAFKAGQFQQHDIAVLYGVSDALISMFKHGKGQSLVLKTRD